ncbi:hypothetical protein OKC48_16065 [Methylorubrum extorquens]|uniref:hypothetical protein n=1 Tax=Methylorubrum extorquens TaxID=408 RepID=UPI002237D0D9|nr:hypothetical protein [Methylorubrum extorquens]UYW24790.1 hypothetical protein OKC48_16065 [Methylorubrum extorquens]
MTDNIFPPVDPTQPTAYRALVLSSEGRILASRPLSACSDDEALSVAMAMAMDDAVELWDGLRFMAHFGPGPVIA